jgi:hypothetical protein
MDGTGLSCTFAPVNNAKILCFCPVLMACNIQVQYDMSLFPDMSATNATCSSGVARLVCSAVPSRGKSRQCCLVKDFLYCSVAAWCSMRCSLRLRTWQGHHPRLSVCDQNVLSVCVCTALLLALNRRRRRIQSAAGMGARLHRRICK